MLTNKGKYGLKAMVHLAGLAEGEVAQAPGIAKACNLSKKFLDQILSELRNAHLVYSKKGKAGGYALAKSAEEIRVGHIIRALDGPLAPIACASVTAYRPCDDCGNEKACEVRLMMQQARDALSKVLDNCTLAEMRALGKTAADLSPPDSQYPLAAEGRGEGRSAISPISAPHDVNRG